MIGGLILTVLYVLSLGPYIYLARNDHIPRPVLTAGRAFYMPVEWSVKYGPDSWGDILKAYVDRWR